jgi:hypothetical protein
METVAFCMRLSYRVMAGAVKPGSPGRCAKSRALPAIAPRFEQIDTDKDGSISRVERREALKP